MLLTLSYSAHPIQKFISLLRLQIQILVDALHARQPFSSPIQQSGPSKGFARKQVDYVFAGRQLGGRRMTQLQPRQLQKGGKSLPSKLFRDHEAEWFRQG
jgi:hypothetical protein